MTARVNLIPVLVLLAFAALLPSPAAAAAPGPAISAPGFELEDPELGRPGEGEPSKRRSGGVCPSSNPCWIDGVGEYQYFENCIQGGHGYVYSYIGYWGKGDFSYPQTGDRYWGHIVASVVGSACGGEYIGTDIEFPAGTSFDLDGTPEGKIRCFYTPGRTGNTEEITNNENADCRQNPGPGVYGGWGLGGRIIPAWGTIEIIFPLGSAQALGTGQKMTAAIDTAISFPKTEFPQAYLAVPEKPSGGGGGGGNPGGGPGGGGGSEPKPSTISAKLQRTNKKLAVSGLADPARPSGEVAVTLSRKAPGSKSYRKVGTSTVGLATDASYVARFARPKKGSCRIKVKLSADPAHGAASKTVTGAC